MKCFKKYIHILVVNFFYLNNHLKMSTPEENKNEIKENENNNQIDNQIYTIKEMFVKDNLLTENNISYKLTFKVENEKLNILVNLKDSFPEEIYSKNFSIDELKTSKEKKSVLFLYDTIENMLPYFEESINKNNFNSTLIDENTNFLLSFKSPLPLMDGPVLIIPKAETDDETLISNLIEEIKRLRNNEKKYEKIIDELTEKVKNMDEEIKNLKQ